MIFPLRQRSLSDLSASVLSGYALVVLRGSLCPPYPTGSSFRIFSHLVSIGKSKKFRDYIFVNLLPQYYSGFLTRSNIRSASMMP